MLSLEQVSALNAALEGGDLNAALLPLEEQIDLRANELPKLSKASVAAIASGLHDAATRETWAQTVFHPNPSVRRFARKTLLGVGASLSLLTDALWARLDEFVATETPLPYSQKSAEAAARRAQMETVENALELLLRADVNRFFARFLGQGKIDRLAAIERQKKSGGQQAYKTLQKAWATQLDALISDKMGPEFLDKDKRSHIPSSVWSELYKRLRADPQIQQMEAQSRAESFPWGAEWNVANAMHTLIRAYLSPSASGVQQEIVEPIRAQLWAWAEIALLETGAARDEAQRNFRSFVSHYYSIADFLGRDELLARAPALLEKCRPTLTEKIGDALSSNGDTRRVGLYKTLLEAIAHCAERGAIPPNITPEWLRSFKSPSDKKYSVGFSASLEHAAKAVEERAKRVATTAPEVAGKRYFFEDAEFLEFCMPIAAPPAETRPIEEPELKARLLLRANNALDQWQKWACEFGEVNLRAALWPHLEAPLWERARDLAAQWKATEGDAPTHTEKLTPRQIREFIRDSQARKRSAISSSLHIVWNLLVQAGGTTVSLALLESLDKPALKHLFQLARGAILGQVAGENFNLTRESLARAQDANWLRAHWLIPGDERAEFSRLVEALETSMASEKKPGAWAKNQMLQRLAFARYRLATPESRERFFELLAETENGLYYTPAFVTLGDVRAQIAASLYGPDMRFFADLLASPDRPRAIEMLLDTIALTGREKGAKWLLDALKDVPPAEFAPHVAGVFACLESPLASIKRWALVTLPKVGAPFDHAQAAELAGEMLWSEVGALAKDAAKFLGTLADAKEAARAKLEDACEVQNTGLQAEMEKALRKLARAK